MASDDVPGGAAPVRGGSRKLQFLIIVLLMIGEGIGIFVLASSFDDGPAQASAAGLPSDEGLGMVGEDELAEVEVAESRPCNRMSGRLVNYHLRVSVLVAAGRVEQTEKMAKAKRARLLDRVNFVVRSADPKHLDEPGLQTIKRRFKQEFDSIFGGEGLIKEVVIPEILQSGPGV